MINVSDEMKTWLHNYPKGRGTPSVGEIAYKAQELALVFSTGLNAIMRDAERYRYLRDEGSWGEDSGDDCWEILGECHAEEFDAIVDKRMARYKQESSKIMAYPSRQELISRIESLAMEMRNTARVMRAVSGFNDRMLREGIRLNDAGVMLSEYAQTISKEESQK